MSRVAELRELLLTGQWTKSELATKTGLMPSTIQVQLSSHLPKKYEVIKEVKEGQLAYTMRERGQTEQKPKVEGVREEPFTGFKGLSEELDEDLLEPATDADLKELANLPDDGSGNLKDEELEERWERVPGEKGYRRVQ